MAEQQSRKTHVVRDPVQRSNNNFVKSPGEVTEKAPTKPKSKNVIPKNLRYDLENALVGLCDVWFEEIKPYLERNNIKVHVHDAAADKGDGDGERCADITPDCDHLHPASTASRCELCRLLFNAANSIESAVSQAASASAVSLKETINTDILENLRRRISKRKHLTENFHSRHRQKMEPAKLASSIMENKLPHRNYTKMTPKPELKDASTQTEMLLKSSINHTRRRIRSGHYNRHSAPTAFLPSIKKEAFHNVVNGHNIQATEVPPLFKNDLIDIIEEKHEERLRVLNKNPHNKYPLFLNLYSCHKSGKRIAESKKERPWKY